MRAIMRGRALRSERVVVYVTPSSGRARVGVVASRKIGGAVARNRARRVLRAAWRGLDPAVRDGSHLVLVARPAIEGAKADEVVEEINRALTRSES